jgi:acyl-CoA dehydrogenase
MIPSYETDVHAQLRTTARRFAQKEIAPSAHEWEEKTEFPRELYRKAAEAGLLGIAYPEEYGGGGGDISHALASSEEMILHGKSVGTVVGLGSHGIALPPILIAGNEQQKRRFIPSVLSGEKVAALAITEPGGGSDVARIATRAVRDGDSYVVNGAKTFITSGCRADLVTVAVRTGDVGHGGVSLIVIERGTPGFSVTRKLEKMGWWASDTAELAFVDCRVPAANLIGDENAGFLTIMRNFATERLYLASNCVAIAELAYRESVAYARDRHAFGKSLTGFQVIRHKLADMVTRIAAARALTNEAVGRHLAGEQVSGLAAMAKNTATDMCCWVCDQAVQIHGGYGYMREFVVERLFRDARLYPIGGGTREIMNEIICKLEGYLRMPSGRMLLVIGLSLLACGRRGEERAEGERIVRQVDLLVAADRTAREAPLRALEALPCSTPQLCQTKESCVAAFRPAVEGERLAAEVRATLKAGAPPEAAAAMQAKLARADEANQEAKTKLDPCLAKTTETKQKLGL